MDETLFMALQRYGREDAIPMHMPGHKRNEALAPYLKALGAGLDITEIDGFDDLHGAEGILRRGMERAAQLWLSLIHIFRMHKTPWAWFLPKNKQGSWRGMPR